LKNERDVTPEFIVFILNIKLTLSKAPELLLPVRLGPGLMSAI
jgi:hypothetical protein